MLTSLAAIATAITAGIGVGVAIYASIRKAILKKQVDHIQDVADSLKGHKTDEERQRIQDEINDITNS